MMGKVLGLAGSLALAGCSVFGIRGGTEETPFTLVERLAPDLEIRAYDPRLAAETTLAAGDEDQARNDAFRRLAAYIFRSDRPEGAIAMTIPVAIDPGPPIAMTIPVETNSAAGSGRTMRFFMPQGLAAAALPAPADPLVRIVTLPARTRAVLSFTGSRGDAALAAREAELRRRLAGTAWAPAGAVSTLLYDPPWTVPFLRRNEVAIDVDRR